MALAVGDDPVRRVLLVCLGNICRSPLAEWTFRHRVYERGLCERFHIESRGTAPFAAFGNAADRRSIRVARSHKVTIHRPHRSRQLTSADFVDFHYILVMDDANLSAARRIAPLNHYAKLTMYHPECRAIIDPHSFDVNAFERVYQTIQQFADHWITLIISDAGHKAIKQRPITDLIGAANKRQKGESIDSDNAADEEIDLLFDVRRNDTSAADADAGVFAVS